MGEDLTPGSDTATRLSTEGRIARDETRRAGPATLGAVQWTVSGVAMAAGAPAVNLVEVGILCTTKYTMYYIVMYSQGKRIWRVFNQFSLINIRCLQEEPKLEVGPAIPLRTEGGSARGAAWRPSTAAPTAAINIKFWWSPPPRRWISATGTWIKSKCSPLVEVARGGKEM